MEYVPGTTENQTGAPAALSVDAQLADLAARLAKLEAAGPASLPEEFETVKVAVDRVTTHVFGQGN